MTLFLTKLIYLWLPDFLMWSLKGAKHNTGNSSKKNSMIPLFTVLMSEFPPSLDYMNDKFSHSLLKTIRQTTGMK